MSMLQLELVVAALLVLLVLAGVLLWLQRSSHRPAPGLPPENDAEPPRVRMRQPRPPREEPVEPPVEEPAGQATDGGLRAGLEGRLQVLFDQVIDKAITLDAYRAEVGAMAEAMRRAEDVLRRQLEDASDPALESEYRDATEAVAMLDWCVNWADEMAGKGTA